MANDNYFYSMANSYKPTQGMRPGSVGLNYGNGQSQRAPWLARAGQNLRDWSENVDWEKVGNQSIGAAAGLGQMAIQTGQMANESLNFGRPQQDLEDPSYQLGGYAGQLAGARGQGATWQEVGGMGLQGAAMGMQVGGPWGAAIGAAVGTGAGLVGGRVRRNRQNREITKAREGLGRAQTAYNTASQEADMNQIQQAEYYKRLNPNRRMRNLYA